MRKIIPKKDLETKQNKKKFLVGFLLVALMVVSTAGYSIMTAENETSSKLTENGITFYFQNGAWNANLNGILIPFSNLPSEVKEIPVTINQTLETYSNKPLYLNGPSDAYVETLNLLGRIALRYQETCVQDQECNKDLPTKNCDDNIIIFDPTGETKVYNDKNCIYIKGDLIKATDAFLFKLLNDAS